MKKPNSDLNRIDQYLQSNLNEQERVEFESDIENDPELEELFRSHSKIKAAITSIARKEKKIALQKISERRRTKRFLPKMKKSTILYFALFLVLGLLGWWYLSSNSKSENIVKEYYQPYAIAMVNRGNLDQQIGELLGNYNSGNFGESSKLAEQLLSLNEGIDFPRSQVLLMLAISNYELQKYDEAINSLEECLKLNNPYINDQVKWYLAIIHIDQGKNQLAIPYLQELADDSGADKHREALIILEKL